MSINQGVLEIIREIFISPITFRKTLAKVENKYLSNKKKGFLEFLQNSQENTCVSLFFNQVAGLRLEFYGKRDSGIGVFL